MKVMKGNSQSWVHVKLSQLRGDFRKKNRRFEDNRQIGEGGQAQTRNTK